MQQAKRLFRAGILLLFVLTWAAQSQTANWNNVKMLPLGTEVRLVTGGRTVRGSVQAVTDDSLVVNSGSGQQTFARQQVMRASVRKKSHRGRNTLIGLGIGTGAGAAVGAGLGGCCSGEGPSSTPVVAAVVVGSVGVGAAIGALLPTGGWQEIFKQ